MGLTNGEIDKLAAALEDRLTDKIATAVQMKLMGQVDKRLLAFEGRLWPILEDMAGKIEANTRQIERMSEALDDQGII